MTMDALPPSPLPRSKEAMAFVGGQWLPATQAAVSVMDGGFVQGVTIAEQLRTFGGKLFRWEEHLSRLQRSLEILGGSLPYDAQTLQRLATELVQHNHALLAKGDDLGLTLFVTPGIYSTYGVAAAGLPVGPLVGMHTYPIPFALWANKYQTGDALSLTAVEQIPANCWPTELKCRSRMHYFLADQAARKKHPGSRALLLDSQGNITESSTANILLFDKQAGLLSPPKEAILPGISVAVVEDLAAKCGIPFHYRPLTPSDVAKADEVLLTSTSPCVWPVTQFEGQPIADGKPGMVFRMLLTAWSLMVGHDIQAQAEHFSNR